MDQVFRSAAGATENGRRSTLAYDGHGRVFTVGEDGLLRSANVRSDFLVGAAARPRAPSKSGTGLPLRVLKPSPPLGLIPLQMSFSRGGQFAVITGRKRSNVELSGIAVIDVIETSTTAGSVDEVGRLLVLGAELFDSRPGLQILQVAWHPSSDHHVGVLTSDNIWRIFSLHEPSYPEQTFELGGLQQVTRERVLGMSTMKGEKAVTFAFGPPVDSWERFTVFFMTLSGSIYILCPVAPFGCRFHLAAGAQPFPAGRHELHTDIQTSEAWLEQALGVQESLTHGHDYVEIKPHALEDHCPALQGPLALHLQSSSPPQATAGNMQSLAVLHWEATVQLRNPQGADTAGGSPPSFCVAVVTAGLSGKISVALMEGNIVPAWKKADSTIWHDAYGSVIAARIVAQSATSSEATPTLSLFDEIHINVCDRAGVPGPDSDSEDDDHDAAALLDVVRDPVSSDRCYIIHGHGAIGISLPWLPVLGGFLAHAANDNQVAPPSLPSTIALDLAGEWGKDGIIGGCLIGNAATGSLLALVKATGTGQLLSTHELYEQESLATTPPHAQQPMRSPEFSSKQSPQEVEKNAASTACLRADAALASQYAWLLAGPNTQVSVVKSPGKSCSDIEGQRDLHAAISQLHKKYVEYITQAHQFVTQKVAEIREEGQRQAAQECKLRHQQCDAAARRSLLAQRIERATKFNANLHSRYNLLSMLDSSRPRPMSFKEQAFMQELPIQEEKLQHWQEQVKTLSIRTRKAMSGPSVTARTLPQSQVHRIKAELETLSSSIATIMAQVEEGEDAFERLKLGL